MVINPIISKSNTVLDFTNVVNKDFNVPNGDYLVRIVEIECKPAANGSGNEVIKPKYEIYDDTNATGVYVWDNITLTQKSAWQVKRFFEAFGVEIPKAMVDLKPLIPTLKDAMACITVRNVKEMYNGEEKEKKRITKYFAYDGGL